jgi:NodT family efflux transporter outer membrane factor (OMF) lipoprotein
MASDNFLALPRRARTLGEGGTHGSYLSPLLKSGDGKLDVSSKTKKKLLPAVIGMIVFLASCTVGPNYVKPTVEVPGAYRENAGWQVAQPQDSTLRGNWWEIFNEPQLNAFEEQVDISNQNVALAEAQYRQARALVQQARAAYFPTVTIGASLNNSSQPPSSRNNNGFSNGSSGRTAPTLFTMAVDASWEIDVWGRIRRLVESSEASAQASAADLENARLSARTELAQDYFQLRTLDTQKQLLDASIVEFQRSLELTNNRYASGVVSRADVLQAQTQLKTTQAQAIDVGVQRAQFEHAIALLIGKPASVVSIPAAPLAMTTVPPPIPVGVPSEVLERRPDIAAAERQVVAANAQIGVALAAYYPTVSLGATGGFESTSLSQWISAPSRFWSVGPAISETVFDGGLRAGLTEQARGVYDGTVASYRETVLTAFQEVEDNLAALRILENEAGVQDEAVKAAQQSVTVFTNQYKAGITSYLEVVTAQTAALTNERTGATILGNRLNAAVLLIKALGGGWNVAKLP